MTKYRAIFWSKRKIIKYINSISNTNITAFFRGGYDGQSYAGNPKRKTNTRVSFIIPKEIAKNNLKFMSEWNFLIIGVKNAK